MNDEMNFSDAAAPPKASPLARAVYAVVQGYDGARVLSLGPRGAAIELGKRATVIFFIWNADTAGILAHNLGQVMAQPQRPGGGRLVVGLVGGGEEARQMLEQARPQRTQLKIGQVHVSDRGELWSQDAGPVAKALSRWNQTSGPSAEQWARLVEESTAEIAERTERTREAQEFVTKLAARRPVATWTLAGILAAVFALEYYFGGTQSPPVLLRMGALAPEKVADGEWWRLFSCTFLHSGPMHFLFNSYVLWILGTQLERILGTWRFLVLYGLSCLGASLVSMTFLDGFSVGASGGLWGLLGAEAVLAWRSEGLLPKAVIEGARKAAVINLGINVINSFRPHVDMWAHFGGGAVGGLLMLSGVLARGVPRLGELEARGDLSGANATAIRTGPMLKAVGSAATVALLYGLTMGLVHGRPWDLQRPFDTLRTPLPALDVSMQLPYGLATTPGPPNEPPSVQIGDLRSDPGAVVVTRFAKNQTDPPAVADELAYLTNLLNAAPQGSDLAAGPEEVTIADSPGVTVTYRYSNGIEQELAFVFLDDVMFKADTLRWPEYGAAVPPGYAVSVLDSIEPLGGR